MLGNRQAQAFQGRPRLGVTDNKVGACFDLAVLFFYDYGYYVCGLRCLSWYMKMKKSTWIVLGIVVCIIAIMRSKKDDEPSKTRDNIVAGIDSRALPNPLPMVPSNLEYKITSDEQYPEMGKEVLNIELSRTLTTQEIKDLAYILRSSRQNPHRLWIFYSLRGYSDSKGNSNFGISLLRQILIWLKFFCQRILLLLILKMDLIHLKGR